MFRFFLLTFFIFLAGNVFVQTNTNTPYSARGIGDVSFYGDAYASGLGGAVTALADSSQTNLFNPSTYSIVAKQLPLFSMGVNHYQKRFSSMGEKSKGQFTGITHMALVIPFGDRFGAAAGIKPFSRSGYSINDYDIVQGDSIYYDYSGKGDIQEALLGFSANLIDGRKHSLSLGVNGKYYFGQITNERKAYRVSNDIEAGGMDLKSLHANGFGVELGMNYNYRPTTEHNIRIAGVYRPGLNLKFNKSENRVFFGNYNEQASYDTIINIESMKGEVYIPTKMSLGFTYIYSPYDENKSGNTKRPSIMLAFDYSAEDWSNYKEEFQGTIRDGQYTNASSYRLGLEFIPHNMSLDHSAYINYFDKVSYRVGAYYANTPYVINGNQAKDKGVTAGLGFPFIMGRAVSTVNISANYGVLGEDSTPGMVKDNYFGFNLGINIAPGYDRWFKKYKLD